MAESFAVQLATDLITRTRRYNSEHGQVWSAWTEPRISLMQELALAVTLRGERDPLLSAMASFDQGRWSPGRRVGHLLEDILSKPEPSAPMYADDDRKRVAESNAKLPNPNELLHRLLVAAMGDTVEHSRQVRDRAVAELAAMAPDARISDLEMAVARAESETTKAKGEMSRAQSSEQELMRAVVRLQGELRLVAERSGTADPDSYVKAVVAGFGVSSTEQAVDEAGDSDQPGAPAPSGAPLPKGIRERGEGRFEALLYRSETLDKRQRGLGSYGSVEEAVAVREDALKHEAERKEAEHEQVAA